MAWDEYAGVEMSVIFHVRERASLPFRALRRGLAEVGRRHGVRLARQSTNCLRRREGNGSAQITRCRFRWGCGAAGVPRRRRVQVAQIRTEASGASLFAG